MVCRLTLKDFYKTLRHSEEICSKKKKQVQRRQFGPPIQCQVHLQDNLIKQEQLVPIGVQKWPWKIITGNKI